MTIINPRLSFVKARFAGLNGDLSLADQLTPSAHPESGEALTFRGQGGTQVSLTTLGAAYTQNFDTLVNTGTSSTVPADWAFLESGANANAIYTAGTGSSNAGDTYSFGSTGSTDRAFGGVASGNLQTRIGVSFTNNTGATITSLDISYFGEQWRLGSADGNLDRLDFQYSLTAVSLADGVAGTWINVDALDFISVIPINTGTADSALDGNLAANRTNVTSSITGLSLATGATIWIRWIDPNITGNDDGLAIDDFSITPQGAAANPGALAIDNVSHSEGDSGTTTYNFTVTRSGGSAGAVSATWTLNAPGGALAADSADFDPLQATTGTVSFADGETSKTITISVQGDDLVETDETFTVVLSAPTNGATIPAAGATGTGTIVNDDAAGTLSIGDVTLAEGDSGTTAFTFIVLRSGGDDGTVGATWTLDAPGGAGLADLGDFDGAQATSGTVSFADGETSKTITILVQGDVTFEATETFLVTLSAPTGGASLGNANGTGTITNDDAAPAGTLSIDDVSHNEGNSGATTYTFTVSRTGGSAGAVTADWAISAPGGAGNASTDDFVSGAILSGQVSFADGETSKTITVDVQGDATFEPDESFTVTLTNATGGASIGDGSGAGTILNDDAAPPTGSVSIADMSIVEGNSGTSTLILTLTRTGGTGAFSVNYATANGGDPTHASATAGSDYVAQSGTVSFADGETTQTISITINGDTVAELSEEFTVTLSGATNGATISDASAIATITNDDTPSSSITIWTDNFDSFLGGGFAPNPTPGQLDSDVYITAGFDDPANPSVDYGGTVTTGDLARGVTAVAVTTGGIYSFDRGSGNHAFLVQPGGTDFTPGTFTMRLVNTSGLSASTFAIAYDILVRNDQGRSNSFNLSYSTDGVNFLALSAFDYTSPDAADALGVVTVARSGQFTAASSVAAGGFLYLRFTGDDVGGSGSRDEFGLDNISVGVAGGAAAPTVAVTDVSVNEAAGTMIFTITRTNLVGGAFSVNYATADGTATAGSDYSATSGTLNFTDNQVSATVIVSIGDDGTPEIDETLFLNLSSATNGALITDAQGVGTIVNDDGTPIQVSINDVSINEGNSGTTILSFTVSRTGGTGAFDVSYATANDSATAPSDYIAASGTLNFAAGQNSQTVQITINGDLSPEQTEQFFVNLSNPTNNAVILDSQGIGTIVNDEGTFIHDIQGTAYFSPILAAEGITNFNQASAAFVTVTAIVTAVDNNGNRQGFYIQEEITDWDGNSYTSEGIYVMTRNDANSGTAVAGVAVGDLVTVTARVMEYQGFTTNMPITALVNASFVVNSTGNTLPAFLLDAGHPIPNSILTSVTPDYTDSSDGAGDTFDASLYGLSFWETVEGMLVTVPDMVVADGFVGTSGGRPFLQAYSAVHADADQINSRGGYTIAGDPPNSPPDTVDTEDGTINGGRVLHDGDINPDIIELDWTGWASAPPAGLATGASMGDQLGDVTGIVDFEFTDRKLYVTSMEPGGFVDSTPTQETTSFGGDDRSLTVATFNVENLDPGDGAARFTALANAIANNLHSPDIICIEEMQDNNGAAGGGVDASTTWQMLVNALNLATGAHYQWVDQEPIMNAEGGEQQGNIRVGFLYNTDRVQLGNLDSNATIAERRMYTDRIGDGVRDSGDLIAFSDNMLGAEINTADWSNTRRSLLGEFTFHGNTVYVTANHWPSKGGSGQVWQFNQDLSTGNPSNSDWAQRNQVAQDVYSMLNLIQSGNPNAGIVSGGDYNDFYFYRPLEVMTGYVLPDGSVRSGGARFDNLTLTLSEAERYTYAFDGRSQAIDHIVVNQLLSAVASYDVVHLNTGFNPTGTPALSDHDPGISTFDYRNFGERLDGTTGADTIDGFGGNDLIVGDTGNDLMRGGLGNDAFIVEQAGDVVQENAAEGYDTVYTLVSYELAMGQEIEVLTVYDRATSNAINLAGNDLANVIYGNQGSNLIIGDGGNDTMYGLGGNDSFVVEQAGDLVIEAASGGSDTIYALTSYELGYGQEVEVLTVYDRATANAINLTGNNLVNTLYGNQGSNVLNGGAGNDVMYGLGGNDAYLVEDGGDVVFEAASGGFDTVYTLTSYQLMTDQSVETLTVYDRTTVNALNLTGNNLANSVYGNNGVNVIDGKGGADTLYGMGGADTFTFTNGPVAGAADFLADFSSVDDTIALDDLAFVGIGPVGALNANAFFAGSAAHDADDRIVYNQTTGQIFFDADGNGAGAQVLFATVNPGTIINASDFTVI